jgi:hypothetical protein
MTVKTITLLVIALFIIGLLGYDVYAYVVGGQDATVSNVIIELSHDYPAGTFLVGFAMGHLFWQMKKPKEVADK